MNEVLLNFWKGALGIKHSIRFWCDLEHTMRKTLNYNGLHSLLEYCNRWQ